MRYRIQFTAKQDDAFHWEVYNVFESNELLELIFQFQMMIAKEFKRIINASNQMIVDNDIPF